MKLAAKDFEAIVEDRTSTKMNIWVILGITPLLPILVAWLYLDSRQLNSITLDIAFTVLLISVALFYYSFIYQTKIKPYYKKVSEELKLQFSDILDEEAKKEVAKSA